eukprot:TRINITY_DN3189_c0_g2_i1.p1 TRINITY_DN3189_c0_g2~~TRINITY_DN3189_c0_g2_i1.p1  ORF type:complete len:3267 (-),score=1104.08 TRINITY_DN3189_c0_g2_i1:31-9831(-)
MQDRKPNYHSVDGNTAAIQAGYACSDLAFLYPITPSSPMCEMADTWAGQNRKNIFGEVVDCIQMQSEGGVSGALHGATVTGALTSTYTCSQGLLLMLPEMYKIAGELQPCVFHVASRVIAGQAMNIFCDHSDVMAVRQTGWSMLSSTSVQEAHDFGAISHLATVKASVPFLHFFDGFRLSHEVNKIDILTNEDISSMYPFEKLNEFRNRAIVNADKPNERGGVEGPDIFWQFVHAAQPYFDKVPQIVEETMDQFFKLTGRRYHAFDYVGAPDAERVVILMGSGVSAVEDVVKVLVQRGEKVGLLKVRLFRPFSVDLFVEALPSSVNMITVLDKTHEVGSNGEPLYLDVVAACRRKQLNIKVFTGRYGIGGKEFIPSDALAVFENMKRDIPKNDFNIGIIDDLLNSHLEVTEHLNALSDDVKQCLFYALGADGTVSANKSAIKIIGDNSDNFCQGYFQYDAKKSGGFTVSHLRFGPEEIHAEYSVRDADYIACHNPAYITQFDMLCTAKQGATFVLNCSWKDLKELEKKLPSTMKKIIAVRKLKFVVIDAFAIADRVGLTGRINMVMQTAFFSMANVLPVDQAVELLKNAVVKTFSKKGQAVVDSNIEAIDQALAATIEIAYPESWALLDAVDEYQPPKDASEWFKEIVAPVGRQMGDLLPVSKFVQAKGGAIPTGTTCFEKRGVALKVPIWDSAKCIQCNDCTAVCSHAAIRPSLVDPEELKTAPSTFETVKVKGKNPDELSYRIQVSPLDCMGCSVCSTVCKKGALSMVPLDEAAGDVLNHEYSTHVKKHGDSFDSKSMKDVQYHTPFLEFSGACAGCMETAHVKLITQLFQEKLYIADACGCSLVWGGMYPVSAWAQNERGHGPSFAGTLFEDAAEFGLGMTIGLKNRRVHLRHDVEALLETNISDDLKGLLKKWIALYDEDVTVPQELADSINELIEPLESSLLLQTIKDNYHLFVRPVPWIIGGDGWAYDIGFGGLDQVLNMGLNANIFVMDTEVYSNTGGQVSKASPRAAVARFAALGKNQRKKDLGLHAMNIGGVYVASISIGANRTQALKAIKEAEEYDGPSIILAYCPCINHGIKKGLASAVFEGALAVETGYWPLYRYDPRRVAAGKNPLQIDHKPAKKPLRELLENEVRFSSLLRTHPERAEELQKALEDDVNHKHLSLQQMLEVGERLTEMAKGSQPEIKADFVLRSIKPVVDLVKPRQPNWMTMDGNTAAITAGYAYSDMSFLYPITPSSPMCEYADKWGSDQRLNIFGRTVPSTQMQSEGGVSGALHGASVTGSLTSTYTCSQGLLLMVPNMYKMSSELQPCVFHVASRVIAGQAMNIFCDHTDVMSIRQTGWSMLSSNSVQEAHDLAVISHLATIETRVPIVHFFDGMRVSHEVSKIDVLTTEEMKSLYNFEALTKYRSSGGVMNNYKPTARGGVENADTFWQFEQTAEEHFLAVPEAVEDCMNRFANLIGRQYHLFDYVGAKDAEHVIVMMSSCANATEETVKYLNNQGQKVGLIKVRLFRPFSTKHLLSALPSTVKCVTVLDKTLEYNSMPPLYLSVSESLFKNRPEIEVLCGIYGIGGKEYTPSHALSVFKNGFETEKRDFFTVGLNDDLTFSNLVVDKEINTMEETTKQCLFYALGADGTVGANKEAVKIIGDNTDYYCQGYFQYDAKKSGGFTTSHLRFGPTEIKSAYHVNNADYVACHNAAYVQMYDLLANAKEGAAFVINCDWQTIEACDKNIPARLRKDIADKKIKLYTIHATNIAENVGLTGRINMVMQTVFFKLSEVIEIDHAINLLKDGIKRTYGKKGDAVVNKNIAAVDQALSHLTAIDYPLSWSDLETLPLVRPELYPDAPEWFKNVVLPHMHQKGHTIPVSKFVPAIGGLVPIGTSQYEKRGVALKVPSWDSNKCIQCNECVAVCPHASIRPIVVESENEFNIHGIEMKGKNKGHEFSIQISPLDCLGCHVCASACPKDALTMGGKSIDQIETWKIIEENALDEKAGKLFNDKGVKNAMMQKPYLQYSAACAGCGETAHIKMVTQLWGDRLYLSDSCGCSLVWGGTYPASAWAKDSNGRGPAFLGTLFEDTAEFGLGVKVGLEKMRERLQYFVKLYLPEADSNVKPLLEEWLNTSDPSRELCDKLNNFFVGEGSDLEKSIYTLKHLFIRPVAWTMGGDGWAYDIGYGGLDHVLNMGINCNIFVLDTEVYSNTGGQVSKSSPRSAVARFAAAGKGQAKKDLGLLAMGIGSVYVASIAVNANPAQALKAIKEAEEYDGPSIILAYSPCINHGINNVNGQTYSQAQLAVECGYWPLYRYNPANIAKGKNPLSIDSKPPKGSVRDFLLNENRFRTLMKSHPERAEALQSMLEKDLELKNWRISQMKEFHDAHLGAPVEKKVEEVKVEKVEKKKVEKVEEKKVENTEKIAETNMIVLFGSDSGNAEGLANTIAKKLNVPIKPMNAETAKELETNDKVIMVTSTVGDGEFPADAESFFNALDSVNVKAQCAICGLGSSDYDLFCQAAISIHDKLVSKNVVMFAPLVKCNEAADDGIEGTFNGFVGKVSASNTEPKAKSTEKKTKKVEKAEISKKIPKTSVDIEDVDRVVTSVCPYCGVGCNIEFQMKHDHIVKVKGAKCAAVNKGSLCIKGMSGMDFLEDHDRLTSPLVRRSDGSFRQATWEEAIELVSKKFKEIKEQYGSNALGGLSSARTSNEDNYIFQKFIRAVFGTNNVDHCARLCHASTVAGLRASFGAGQMTNTFADMEESDMILVIGSNTTEAHPVAALSINRAVKNGAKLVVIDPRAVDLTKKADRHLQIRPGTDIPLLNAIMKIIIEENLHNKKFIETKTKDFDLILPIINNTSVAKSAEICDVSVEAIREVALWYAQAKNATIVYTMGVTQHTHGVANVRSIANLALLCGQIGRPGAGVNPLRGQNNVQGACDLGALPNVYPSYFSVEDKETQERFEKEWGVELSNTIGYSIGEMMNAAHESNFKGMFIMGENPVVTDPNANHVVEALGHLDFLVVSDIFLTETAQLADVVLPAAALAEEDGSVTNTERRVQRIRKVRNAPGLALPDYEIICKISTAMGYLMNYKDVSEITDEMAKMTPSYGGISLDRIDNLDGIHTPCTDKYHPGTPILHRNWFNKPDGLAIFAPCEYTLPAELPNSDYPLVLMTGRQLQHYHSGSMTRRCTKLNKLAPECIVEMNEKDAKVRGINEGDMVKIVSKRGEIVAKCAFKRVRQGDIFIPFHYAEAAANKLTNDVCDPIAKIPELKFCAVQVMKEN